ncbi:MAG TPA: hypothetical protein VHN79_11200, partial [Lacunisphaera sp.]|nr:hypothetical protein [Lacunisphaera sp.]
MSTPLPPRRALALLGLFLCCGFFLPVSGAPDPEVLAGWTAFQNGEEAKAKAIWEKAAQRGVAAAYAGLGVLHLEGAGVDQNAAGARRLFELGAAKRDPDSTIRLARL